MADDAVDRLNAALADRYEIERELGAGGMASVYLAHDLKHDRKVAIKVMHPELSAILGGERFLQEIRIAAKLNHPHILALYDSGNVDGFLYYVMPHVEGESLRLKIEREKQLAIDEAATLTRQVASALDYAHEQGVIHRDIKPENILLHRGVAIVADFGIALAVTAAGGERLTETGLSLGTPEYMSPEQAAGDRDVDARSDIYSLGAVLYEMLMGEPPQTGATVQAVIAKLLAEKPTSPRVVRDSVPEAMDQAVMKALAKVPTDRFASAGDFAVALTAEVAEPAEEKKSIAVLPFVNMSADQENEYFSDGLAEDLINALTNIKDFRVAARTSAFSFKGQQVDARTIGQTLNVGTVLEGSVRKAGNRLRITAELVNAENGYHVWSEQYDRVIADVFTVQDEITGAIVDALKIELLAEEKDAVNKRHTHNVDAYNHYLRGRYYWNRGNPEAFRKAIEQFQAAIRSDPGYARAYAGMADAYASMGDAGHSAISPKQAFSIAKDAVQQALLLDNSLAEAHTSMGHLRMHEFAWSEAQREFSQAVGLNPNYATAYHFYSFYRAALGQLSEAVTMLERALELDPVSLPINTDMGVLFYFARRFDEAVAQYQKVLDMDSSFTRAYMTMGSVYAQMGMHEEAIEMLSKAMELSGDRSKVAALGRVWGMAGKKDRALECVAELEGLSKERYITPYAVVLIYSAIGDVDEALEWLQKAYVERVSDLIYIKVDPFLDNLRSDPRFNALLEKVGLM